jgi:hypothetical protein
MTHIYITAAAGANIISREGDYELHAISEDILQYATLFYLPSAAQQQCAVHTVPNFTLDISTTTSQLHHYHIPTTPLLYYCLDDYIDQSYRPATSDLDTSTQTVSYRSSRNLMRIEDFGHRTCHIYTNTNRTAAAKIPCELQLSSTGLNTSARTVSYRSSNYHIPITLIPLSLPHLDTANVPGMAFPKQRELHRLRKQA